MAGSRRSPVLRDQWRSAGDAKYHRNRDRPRPRGSRRDRGRGRPTDRGRYHPSRVPGPDRLSPSPPPSRSFPLGGQDEPRSHRDSSPRPFIARDSPGPHPATQNVHGVHPQRLSLVANHQDFERHDPLPGPRRFDHRRDDSPSGPPPKRKRTRSPSPRSRRGDRPPKHGGGPDRGFSHKKRGRFSGRGRSGRRSPRRGRDGREGDFGRFDMHSRRSRSPPRGGKFSSPRRSSRSPFPGDFPEEDYRYRSPSAHSFSQTSRLTPSSRRNSKGDLSTNATKPTQSIVDDSARTASPPRHIPSFDADVANPPQDGESSLRDPFPVDGTRPSGLRGNRRPRPHRPHVDARRYSKSPRYVTPTNSHGSPEPTSPYSAEQGWGAPSHYEQHG